MGECILCGKKWLETTLLQESSNKVINAYSLRQFLEEVKAENLARKVWMQAEHIQERLKEVNRQCCDSNKLDEADSRFDEWYPIMNVTTQTSKRDYIIETRLHYRID